MNLFTYATPHTLRDFGSLTKDRLDRGLGKPKGKQNCTEPARTSPCKTYPGGKVMRSVLPG